MLEFPKAFNIPLGEWVDGAMDWVLATFGNFFDAAGNVILQFMLMRLPHGGDIKNIFSRMGYTPTIPSGNSIIITIF